MTESEKIDLGMIAHNVASGAETLAKAASTAEGRDELRMMLKTLTQSYWDLGKVLMKTGYATSKQAAE